MHHEMVCRQHDGRFQSSLDGSLTNGVMPQSLGTGGLLESQGFSGIGDEGKNSCTLWESNPSHPPYSHFTD